MKHTAVLLAVSVSSAFAQSVDIQQVPDLPIRTVPADGAAAQPSAGWKFSAGGGLSYAPRYEGSASNRLRFMPLLDASYNNGKLFISALRGVGYNFSATRNAQYGLRLAPGHGRKQNADPRLNGMGNIGYSIEAGVFLNLRFAPWYVSSGLTTGVHGTHAELGAGIGFPLSPRDRLRLGTNLNWGNTKYNQTYFGVTSIQAAASGNVLSAYDASAGIKDYAFTANWMHGFSKEWFSSANYSFKRLTGSTQYSPLVMRRSFNSFNFLLGYRF